MQEVHFGSFGNRSQEFFLDWRSFSGHGRVLWYALSGEYEIDQRLNSIGK